MKIMTTCKVELHNCYDIHLLKADGIRFVKYIFFGIIRSITAQVLTTKNKTFHNG